MAAWQAMLLALGALMVGALLPVLVQLRLTLRSLGANDRSRWTVTRGWQVTPSVR